MKRPAEVTDFLCCGGVNCDGNCNSGRNVEECLTWRVHGYIEQLESLVPRWIPVEERLPEKHRAVLVHLRVGMIETGVHNGRNWWDDLGIANNENVTHWMPLPEAPEVEHETVHDCNS